MDWKNETNHILMISQMHPAITRDFYLNDIKYGSKIDAYKEFFVGVVHLIASDMNMTTRPERIESHWSRLIDFERRLANITIPRQEQENISHLYNKFTMSNFTALIDAVNWELYYKSIMPVEVFDRLIKPKTDEFTFNVMHPKFFKNFNDLLSSTTKETIFDYMIWRMISGTTHFFDNRFRTLEQKHDSVTTGSQTVESRWKICSGYSKHVDMASGALYVRNFFTKEDNQEANILANNLKESFKNIIRHTEWMDRETQIKAVEKLSFKQNASFLELHHALAQWEVRKNYFDLLKSFDRNKFDVNPAIVNAFYSHLQNSIRHQFDKIGSLKNWWSPSSKKNFDKQMKCIRNQYGEYVEPLTQEHLDGNLTVGENIADNGGDCRRFFKH
uniref:Peptidase M13 N-terminal domain-containing protein n=1 Tax=Romanomermis culicivorax TaxID=13658 RepID=A0A915JCV0_ROMCU